MSESSAKPKWKHRPRKPGWRGAEQGMKYRDKGLVTLALVRGLEDPSEPLPKTYRMVEVKWEAKP